MKAITSLNFKSALALEEAAPFPFDILGTGDGEGVGDLGFLGLVLG